MQIERTDPEGEEGESVIIEFETEVHMLLSLMLISSERGCLGINQTSEEISGSRNIDQQIGPDDFICNELST